MRGLVACIPALAVAACAGPFETRVPDALPSHARIAAMPSRVIIYQLGADGNPTPVADESLRSAAVVDSGVAAWLRGNGGRMFDGKALPGAAPPYDELRPWMEQAMHEIAGEVTGTTKSHRRSVAEWRWPGGLPAWRTALHADFVLLVRLWDDRPTLGRAALNNLFPPVADEPDRTEAACVLSLVDGRLVSCSFAASTGPTVQTEEGDREGVGHVLDGLFSSRDNWSR